MKGFGKFLMGLGAVVGVAAGVAWFAHIGVDGVPWLINVALAKLAFAASGGLMAGGALTVRLAKRREQMNLPRGES